MRVLFSCTPGDGHTLPLVPLARAAANQGHVVAFATSAERAPRIAAEGFDALPAGMSLADALRQWEGMRAALQLERVPIEDRRRIVFGERFGRLDAPAKLGDLRDLMRTWRPDLVVHESSDLSAPIAAAEAGIASVHHSFGRTIPAPAVERAAEIVEPLWRDCGLDPDPWAGLYRGPYIDICPPAVQDEHPPPHTNVQPMRAAERTRPRAARDRPLVYATLGTIFNAVERLRELLTAVDGLDCDVVLTVGRTVDPADLGAPPANTTVEQYVPQAEVLADATAVVAHGGSGSTWGALAHGCALVLLPTGADQFDNALACSRAGAAVTLLPDDQTPEEIRKALATVLRERPYREAAAAIEAEIAALPGAPEVAARLEPWARTFAG